MKKVVTYTLVIATVILLSNCGTSKNDLPDINLFTIQQDRELGQQVAQEIANNPQEYPVLDSASNSAIYQYLYSIRDRILNSGQVEYKEEFAWKLKIIHDDETKNAFCTPGGFIYVYTGLMKYLDSEEQLAGVLAHEIGHADRRHSTRQMTKIYGVQALVGVIAGDRELIKQVTTSIIGLKFSRNHETEADQASVKYLCPTEYDAAGGAKFFEKIQAAGGSSVPEFLSTHPNPENRIEYFYNQKTKLGCSGDATYESRYQQKINLLP